MRTAITALPLCALALLASEGVARAQTLTKLTNQPPTPIQITFLLTDGTVLAQSALRPRDWYRLAPDASGNYADGAWTIAASLPKSWGYEPSAFASAVLADGRLLIEGGEYNGGGGLALTNLGGLYDPVANTWTPLPPPPGWDYIGDSPSLVLPGGQFLIGRKLDQQVAMLDPATMQWTLMGTWGKADFNSEEGWTLMPDGTVLTYDVLDAPNAEHYLPWLGMWLSDTGTVVDLHSPPEVHKIKYPGGYYYPPGETGPGILRPDGTVFATGAAKPSVAGHTSIYTPGPGPTTPGTWAPGPDFPGTESAGDTSAALLPSGNVLVTGANTGRLYEFDGATIQKGPAGGGFLMMLPNGQALVASYSSVSVYSSAGEAQPGWAPAIASVPASLTRGSTYVVQGTQFNGLSQAAAFGDELQTATNYPLVRITNVATGNVFYAHTHDHSSMGVATGSLQVSTSFDVPVAAEAGASRLQVVANGIASTPVNAQLN